MMKSNFQKILTGERPIEDVCHYIVGKLRYKLYYSKYFKWLIRKHILEQIVWRIKWMEQVCYDMGSCKLCGCETTALQMANKPCDKPCYPRMLNATEWKLLMRGSAIKDSNGTWIVYLSNDKEPMLLKENLHSYAKVDKKSLS